MPLWYYCHRNWNRNLKESSRMKSIIMKKTWQSTEKIILCFFLSFKNHIFFFKLAKLRMKGASLFVKECLFLLTMISCSLLSVSIYYSILITLYQLLMLALYTKSHIIPVIHILIHLQVIFVPFYLYSHSKYYQCITFLSYHQLCYLFGNPPKYLSLPFTVSK